MHTVFWEMWIMIIDDDRFDIYFFWDDRAWVIFIFYGQHAVKYLFYQLIPGDKLRWSKTSD